MARSLTSSSVSTIMSDAVSSQSTRHSSSSSHHSSSSDSSGSSSSNSNNRTQSSKGKKAKESSNSDNDGDDNKVMNFEEEERSKYHEAYDEYLEEQLLKFQKLKRLPPAAQRKAYWKYQILRPWESQPAKNYFELLNEENPWLKNPPSSLWLFIVLLFFVVINFLSGFLSVIVNRRIWFQRIQMLGGPMPTFLLPWWFLILMSAVAHMGSALAAWFVYLTGGLSKTWKLYFCYWMMLGCVYLWPDVMFHSRSIAGATILILFALFFCMVNIVLFSTRMLFAGALLVFQVFILGYQAAVLIKMWMLFGPKF